MTRPEPSSSERKRWGMKISKIALKAGHEAYHAMAEIEQQRQQGDRGVVGFCRHAGIASGRRRSAGPLTRDSVVVRHSGPLKIMYYASPPFDAVSRQGVFPKAPAAIDMASGSGVVTITSGLKCLPVSNYEKASTLQNGRRSDYSTFSCCLGAAKSGAETGLSLASQRILSPLHVTGGDAQPYPRRFALTRISFKGGSHVYHRTRC